MQPVEAPQYDVGVLVGRFQVHELHDGHLDLLDHVFENHDRVIIFLGVSPLPNSASNPLDFESRKQMLLDEYPQANVLYVNDHPSDHVWSRKLDEQITSLVLPGQSVMLYGGRDSFLPHYHGRFPTQELMQDMVLSGTEIRRQIARGSARNSPDFRAGAIWASMSRFPTAYQCVDVAVFNEDQSRILLGRKRSDGERFRFFGGFSDPSSEALEQDARREVKEEAGIDITDPVYVGSAKIDDWRYRYERDCIKTALFRAKYLSGRPTPGDDIDGEVKWFDLTDLNEETLVPAHHPLLDLLKGKKL